MDFVYVEPNQLTNRKMFNDLTFLPKYSFKIETNKVSLTYCIQINPTPAGTM